MSEGLGTFLVVQWLRLPTSNAGGTVLIPGWETKTPDTVGCGQKKKVNESFIRQSKMKVNIPY